MAGAGTSIEAGLPSWQGLINTLLNELAAENLDEESRPRWVEAISAEGPIGAAAVVEALSVGEDDFRERIRRALYEAPPTAYVPGALAQQIAWLKGRLSQRVTLATGNYDALLEAALRERGMRVDSFVELQPERPSASAVYHLHGRLAPRYRETGRVVLAESEYMAMQAARHWQDDFMSDLLQHSLCIFVGASLTDPNLIRWLHRNTSNSHDTQHLALFTRQATPSLERPVRSFLETATRVRWDRVGVEVVWADFFSEVAQFVHELGLYRTRRSVQPFLERARRCHARARARMLPASSNRLLRRRQDEISDYLADAVRDVRAIAAAGGIDLSPETLGLAVWGVDHDRGTAAVWAASDRRLNSLESVVENPLTFESRWTAVNAITRGGVLQQDPDVYASRWRLIRAVPIFVPFDGSDGRVPVGALTLTSTTPMAESALHWPTTHHAREASQRINGYLARTGARLFR